MLYTSIQQLLPVYIKGKVFCNTNIPVSGAQVYFVPKIEESVTSSEGEFVIATEMSLPITLIVCHKNYQSCKLTIFSAPQNLVITLNEK